MREERNNNTLSPCVKDCLNDLQNAMEDLKTRVDKIEKKETKADTSFSVAQPGDLIKIDWDTMNPYKHILMICKRTVGLNPYWHLVELFTGNMVCTICGSNKLSDKDIRNMLSEHFKVIPESCNYYYLTWNHAEDYKKTIDRRFP